MHFRTRGFRAQLLAALFAAFFLSGCSDEGLFPATARIDGQVVDVQGDGISQIDIGVVYDVAVALPAVLPVAAVSATLTPPYPNPVTTNFIIPVTFNVQAEAPTARVEVLVFQGGVAGTIKLLHDGAIPPDTTFQWQGRDVFEIPVPNGLYKVRVTIPATSEEGEQASEERTVIVNRPSTGIFGEIFNTQSGFDGRYVLDDLAVGESFTATADNGAVLGAAFLLDRVTVIFRDPAGSFQDAQTVVSIGPSEVVDLITTLNPIFSPADRAGLR